MAHKKKPTNFLGRILLALGLIGVATVVAAGIWVIRGRNWDGHIRFTTVDLRSSPVQIKSFDPQTERGLIIELPANLQIDSVSGRGQFPIGSLVAAGNKKWAADSIAATLGIFVQGEVSALSGWDKLSWWWWQTRVAWQDIDLAESSLFSQSTSVDGATYRIPSPGWEAQADLWFSSLAVAQDQLSIEIVNTTAIDGLAAAASRPLESAGIKVSQVSQQLTNLDKCEFHVPSSMRKLVSTKLIAAEFDCVWKDGEQPIMFLGTTYKNYLKGGN